MSLKDSLVDLLGVLHDGDLKVATAQFEVRDWFRPLPTTVIVVEEDQNGALRPAWRGAGPFPRETESCRRVWFAAPDRVRVEIRHLSEQVRVAVRDGDRWWRWDRQRGIDTGQVDAVERISSFPPILNPAFLAPLRLLPTLRLEMVGTGERVGRSVFEVRARPRQQPTPSAKVHFDLEFDAVNGTVLRHARFEDEICVMVTQCVDCNFNAAVDTARFQFDR